MIEALGAVRDRFGARAISRVASIPIAIGTGGLLGVARWLEPAAAGHGTHLQLGLRPCSVLAWTGYPCPMCGATTTFALMADGRVIEAALNQPFATGLFLLCLVSFGVAAAEIAVPRNRWARFFAWVEPWEGWLAGGFLLAMAAGWAWKVVQMGGSNG